MNKKSRIRVLCITSITFLMLLGCSLFGASESSTPETPAKPPQNNTSTPTPTSAPLVVPSEEIEKSRCSGLSGEIEIWVRVGPAEVVGLEPFAVGSAPFTVSPQPPHTITGGGPLSYNEILTEKWGTYEVNFQMDTTITGACSGKKGSETLNIDLTASGEQNVVVDAEGFQGEYPWAGTHTFNLDMPLEDGASIEGEGYIFDLHLN